MCLYQKKSLITGARPYARMNSENNEREKTKMGSTATSFVLLR